MKSRFHKGGFTLMELMISTGLMVLIATGIMSFYILLQNVWHRCTMALNTSLTTCAAMNRVIYGASPSQPGLRAASATSVSDWNSSGSYSIFFNTNRFYAYDATAKTITDQSGNTIAREISSFTGTINNSGVTLSMVMIQSNGQHTITGSVTTFVSFRN